MDKHASDLVASFRKMQKRRDLSRAIVDYYHSQGISKLSYHGHFSDGSLREPVADGFPEDWVRHYIDDHLDLLDPIPMIAAQRVRPFRWSDAQNLAELSPEMVAYLLEMRLAGLGEGLAMTVFGPNLRNAYVSLGFAEPDFDPDPDKIMEFQFVAQAGHLRFCELADAARGEERELSPREREVLTLIASGKSNSVIAELMSLSTHTVDAYVRGIYQKFGVNDRTSATLVGLRQGLVRFPQRR